MEMPSFGSLGTASVTTVIGTTDTATLQEFQDMTLALMKRHGVGDWNFRFDQAHHRAGQCIHGVNGQPGTLSFSAPLMSLWSPAQQLDTVLHEIAHALCGPDEGHSAAWIRQCIRIGAKPERCWSPADQPSLPSRWTGRCAQGHEYHRERQPRTSGTCGYCNRKYDPRYPLTWTRNN